MLIPFGRNTDSSKGVQVKCERKKEGFFHSLHSIWCSVSSSRTVTSEQRSGMTVFKTWNLNIHSLDTLIQEHLLTFFPQVFLTVVSMPLNTSSSCVRALLHYTDESLSRSETERSFTSRCLLEIGLSFRVIERCTWRDRGQMKIKASESSPNSVRLFVSGFSLIKRSKESDMCGARWMARVQLPV